MSIEIEDKLLKIPVISPNKKAYFIPIISKAVHANTETISIWRKSPTIYFLTIYCMLKTTSYTTAECFSLNNETKKVSNNRRWSNIKKVYKKINTKKSITDETDNKVCPNIEVPLLKASVVAELI